MSSGLAPTWCGGDWKGLWIAAADYAFVGLRVSDPNGGGGTSEGEISVVVIDIEAEVPWVRVFNKGALDRPPIISTASFTSHHDHLEVDFYEHKDYNWAFEIHSRDPEFARQLFDRAMRNWMLAAGPGIGYELSGSRVVLSEARLLEPEELPTLFDAAKGFIEHIPPAVWDAYEPTKASRQT